MRGPRRRHHGRTARRLAIGSTLMVLALLQAPASALILEADDGGGNTSAPPDDPGWRNVGRRLGGPSVVYLGDRWVLTADHVGAGVVVINGARFDPIPTSIHNLRNDDGTLTDLLLFRIDGDPLLPGLALSWSPPQMAEEVILVGYGASRGPPLSIGSPPEPLRDGYHWISDGTRRWGTNLVAGGPSWVTSGGTRTLAIPTVFDRIDDPQSTLYEAQAALGDSGGALFARADRLDPESGWLLAGILFTVSTRPGQPARTTFFENITFSADLTHYREQILRIARPNCLDDARRAAEPEWACPPVPGARPERAEAAGVVWLLAALGGGLMIALWVRRGRSR